MRLLTLVVAASTTLTLAPFAASGADRSATEPQGRIAYSARFWPKDWRIVDNWEVFLLQVGDSKSVRLTRNPRCDEVSPAWSGDGRWIAFACGWGPSAGISVIRSDGSRRRSVVRLPNRRPEGVAWSADDRKLAFALGSGIWTVNVDGTSLRRVSRGKDGSPTWSGDSQTIVFEREARGVYQMKANGSDQRRIAAGASSPTWSPDGRTIAFLRSGSIWLMDAGGTHKRRPLGLPRSGISSVVWSPDGRYLAYERYERPATRGVHVIALDGTQRRHVLWAADPPLGYAWGPS